MVTTAKKTYYDKTGREVLYFDVPEKTGIVSVIGADTALGAIFCIRVLTHSLFKFITTRRRYSYL